MSKGCVYLIHFERRFKHAQHYRGYTKDRTPEKRIEEHRNGTGARIMQVVNEAGIPWVLARVWKGKGRKFERNLKKVAICDICPICQSIEELELLEGETNEQEQTRRKEPERKCSVA